MVSHVQGKPFLALFPPVISVRTVFFCGAFPLPRGNSHKISIDYLVGGWPTHLKNDGVRQLGWWHSQYDGKVIKYHGSKPPTRHRLWPDWRNLCILTMLHYEATWIAKRLVLAILHFAVTQKAPRFAGTTWQNLLNPHFHLQDQHLHDVLVQMN